MKHNEPGAELGSGFHGLAGQLDRPFPLAGTVRGKFIAVRVVDRNLHRHRTEIMDADHVESSLGKGSPDPVKLRDTQSVPQFNRVEPHPENFGDNRLPVVMSGGVPVSREGKHQESVARSSSAARSPLASAESIEARAT